MASTCVSLPVGLGTGSVDSSLSSLNVGRVRRILPRMCIDHQRRAVRSRVHVCVAALGVAAMTAVTALAQPAAAPAIPTTLGTAAGNVRVGNVTVTLKHAYALAGTLADERIYQIVLTDAPVPAKALARELARGGQALLKAGKLSGLSLLAGPDGSIRNIVPYIGELRGSQMLASAGSVDGFKVTTTSVIGQSSRDGSRTGGQGWSYAAGWNAAVAKP